MNGEEKQMWLESEEEGEREEFGLREYDITASPNDFNIITMFSFIESGAVKIPGFQRNYVWDIKRASRLIESLIIGLPIPQIFLYEEGKNSFLVIDGQQRLMSIYYFMKKRFPLEEKRSELRQIFDKNGKIPESILEDDVYFEKFNLKLNDSYPKKKNRLNGLNYETLDELKNSFDLRTIRNVIIKQNSPKDDDSSIYEVFNRLNSGGVNLTAQEIRISLYHSRFYDMLYRLNLEPNWRRLVGIKDPDLHMKDVEILLRGFAMMIDSDSYAPSMKKFLNVFSRKAKDIFGVTSSAADQKQRLDKLESIFKDFLAVTSQLPEKTFYGRQSGKFNISIFEAIFSAYGKPLWFGVGVKPQITEDKVDALKDDKEFIEASLQSTADTVNVLKRLERAKSILV